MLKLLNLRESHPAIQTLVRMEVPALGRETDINVGVLEALKEETVNMVSLI